MIKKSKVWSECNDTIDFITQVATSCINPVAMIEPGTDKEEPTLMRTDL